MPYIDGFRRLQCARAVFNPSLVAGERTQAAHTLVLEGSDTIPDHALILGGVLDIITTFTSATDAATLAISVEGPADIRAATAISNATDWDQGLQAIIPKFNTPETTTVRTSQARGIVVTVAGGENLTAGKLVICLFYVVSDA